MRPSGERAMIRRLLLVAVVPRLWLRGVGLLLPPFTCSSNRPALVAAPMAGGLPGPSILGEGICAFHFFPSLPWALR
jgi:hypothetical protein